MEKNVVKEAIQVCLTVNDENFDREYDGLLGAMQHLDLKKGSIVTLNQSDTFEKENMVIKMIPASEFLEK
jgi:predicted AAA+ superfamily ATPase